MDIRHTNAWKKQREKAFRSSDGFCYLCGQPVQRGMSGELAPEVDHIIPISRGGDPFALENLAVVHKVCNRLKSSKTSEEIIGKRLAEFAVKALQQPVTSGIDWLTEEEEEENGEA